MPFVRVIQMPKQLISVPKPNLESIAEFGLIIILHSWTVGENQHIGNIHCYEQDFFGLDPIMKAWIKLVVGQLLQRGV